MIIFDQVVIKELDLNQGLLHKVFSADIRRSKHINGVLKGSSYSPSGERIQPRFREDLRVWVY